MYKTEHFIVKPITSHDLSYEYFNALNDFDLNKYTDRCRHVVNRKQAEDYINSHFVFGIFSEYDTASGSIHRGNIGIDNIDHINRSCEIGLFIWHQNKGVGSECLPVVVDHCFNRLNMQRVWMGTLASNLAMNKLAVKCGFHLEGSQKRARIINNKYEDVMTYVKFCD